MNNALPNRRNPRWHNYDYHQSGAYFVTICTHERLHLFGHVANEIMHLSAYGDIAAQDWTALTQHYPHLELDLFVVMPNHMHGILLFIDPAAASLSNVVGAYKGGVSRRVNALRSTPSAPVWQRSFHDRIIRSQQELDMIRQYVDTNPAQWTADRFWGEG
jgi:putative transposase